MAERKLTAKQLRFIEVYSGNGTEAARLAGYEGDDNTLAQAARHLLRNPQIVQAIREREDIEIRPLVATRVQRQRFWSKIMNSQDKDVCMQDKLRASELLGKSEADFTEKVEHHLTDAMADRLEAARKRVNGKRGA